MNHSIFRLDIRQIIQYSISKTCQLRDLNLGSSEHCARCFSEDKHIRKTPLSLGIALEWLDELHYLQKAVPEFIHLILVETLIKIKCSISLKYFIEYL